MTRDLPSPIEPTAAQPPSLWRYGFGLGLSVALTALLLWIDVEVVSHPDMGYGGLLYIWAAIFIGAPLAVALVITWLVYMVKAGGKVPGRVHLLMFVPPLLSLFVIPVADDIRRADAERLSERHPAIEETHVNLSGRPLWLAPGVDGSTSSGAPPEMPMRPAPLARFVSFTRYPNDEGLKSGSFPYDGTRLRDGIATYTYGAGDAGDQAKASARTVPLVRLPYPDLHELTPYVPEQELVVYQYFHYGDRVEVAPGLAPAMPSNQDELLRKVPRLAKFYMSRRIAPAIARVEVNGQTLAIGDDEPITVDAECRRPYASIGYALLDSAASIKLRWQTLDDPSHWHEASLALPPLRTSTAGKPASFPSVLLYFTGDDRVAAERFQLLRLDDDRKGLLASGLPAGVPAAETCGSAMDGYDPETVTLLH